MSKKAEYIRLVSKAITYLIIFNGALEALLQQYTKGTLKYIHTLILDRLAIIGNKELILRLTGIYCFLCVVSENAADIANQLLNLTGEGQQLTSDKVNDVIQKLKKIVNDEEINESLGSTVITIFSNILTSSDNVLAASSSE